MKNVRVVIIYGAYGCREENWFPWLKAELEAVNIKVVIPLLPTPENQSLSSWKLAFCSQVGELTASDILVGHSLGAVFALRLLEHLKTPVLGTVLVGGFLGAVGIPKFDTINISFFSDPFNWRKIQAMSGTMTLFDGDNDPYVPREQADALALCLDRKMVWIENGGHINQLSGHIQFPELLELIRQCSALSQIRV